MNLFRISSVNWKTTALGVAALISVAANWYATGIAPTAQDVATVLTGFGLIAAQDSAQRPKG